VVVFPSLPVTPIILHGASFKTISISDVKIAPLCTSFTISGLSGLQLGDLKIKSNPCKFSRLFSPVYKLKLHSLELDKKNIEPKLDNLSKIEEELVYNNEQKVNLQKLNLSIMLAKQILEKSYDEMKNSVTPKFTENLSKNISKITNGKYSKVKFNEETGLVVELENGDNVLAEKLSVGTIDQLYLSLRLSMVDELSEEKVPILLDEAFAFYDNSRLENILKYLNENYKNRQIIIFTCTDREKNILNKNNILFNYIEL